MIVVAIIFVLLIISILSNIASDIIKIKGEAKLLSSITDDIAETKELIEDIKEKLDSLLDKTNNIEEGLNSLKKEKSFSENNAGCKSRYH